VANPSAPGPEEVSGALRRRLAGRFAGEVADAEAPAWARRQFWRHIDELA